MRDAWKDETVALAMPVYDKVHHQAWSAHMKIAMQLGSVFPLDQLALFHIHGYPQPHAQNYLINGIMKHVMPNGKRPDWILWVEADTVPPIDSFELLREHADPTERPVMHGISFDREPPYDPSIWEVNSDSKLVPIHDWKDNTIYKIYHSGTCVVLFHTSVFERLERPWYRMQPFEPGCAGMIPCISLSQRMHEAKVPIYAFTGCVAGHVGEAPIIGADISRKSHNRVSTKAKGGNAGLRKYDNYESYIAHQKTKTEAVKKGTCKELGDFDDRKKMFAGIFNRDLELGIEQALCLGARRGEEVQALNDMGIKAVGVDLVAFPPLVVRADFHKLPFDDGDFDLVFSNSVDHVYDLKAFASEAQRVCESGGIVMLHLSLGQWSDEMSFGITTPKTVVDAFSECEVETDAPIQAYGGGINHLLILRKK